MSHSHQERPEQARPSERREELLRDEGRFWDLQEEQIASLYARPHDWRFIPALAERITAPRVRALERIIAAHRAEIGSLLDIGCGNGWFCHAAAKRGIKSVGVDLSEKKIETARALAREQGLEQLCSFHAGDVLAWQPEERFDLLTSHGSLHHFPELERALFVMLARFAKPGALLLFVEPNHEGMPPGVQDFLLKLTRSPAFARFFDLDFYLEVSGQKDVLTPPSSDADPMNIRSESPAGKEFFGEHLDLDRFFRANFDIEEVRFFHSFVGHATNAFYVFMKPRLVRWLWRAALPALVWYDDRRLRRPEHQRYAEEGLWLMRQKKAART